MLALVSLQLAYRDVCGASAPFSIWFQYQTDYSPPPQLKTSRGLRAWLFEANF